MSHWLSRARKRGRGKELAVADDPIVMDRYPEIRDATYHPDLSRSLDKRSFEEGNPRAGILSLLHGGSGQFRDGQPDSERAAVPRPITVHHHGAPMHLDEPAHQSQANADSLCCLDQGF
jgi:hypothetical protein